MQKKNKPAYAGFFMPVTVAIVTSVYLPFQKMTDTAFYWAACLILPLWNRKNKPIL